jgi:hypothetical protein
VVTAVFQYHSLTVIRQVHCITEQLWQVAERNDESHFTALNDLTHCIL